MEVIKDDYIRKIEAVKILQKAYAEGRIKAKDGCVSVLDDINALPAADVQPVKRGKWKYYKNNGIIDTYICTNCQGKVEMTIDVESSKFKYCPNCGARMDIIYEDDKIRAIKVTGW